MERCHQKNSKISGVADRSSGDGAWFAERAFREGNQQIPNPGSFRKVASDSNSCSSGNTEEALITFELGRKYSGREAGTPIKRLLAEEMSKERESKRRSPSIIARLMGLDGLPSQQPAPKQQKRSSDNYQQRTTSVTEGKTTLYEGRSFRKSSKEEQEFKDVFEVLETSKVDCRSNSMQRTRNSKLTEAEMAFIRQKFMDAKRLSTDEKLQDSKEFNDALEVLDSNKDLLLKFLQEPDSLFTKHLHELQGTHPRSHCSHAAVRKTFDGQKFHTSVAGFKSDRETMCKNQPGSPHKHCDSSPNRLNCRGPHSTAKSSIIRSENKHETSGFPTRIVVLKPNLGKMQNVCKSVPSPPSSHSFLSGSMQSEFLNVRGMEAELQGKKNYTDDVGNRRHKSRESREIAKDITRRMRNSYLTGSLKFSSSGFKGYAGDESSSYMSGNDSATESDGTSLTTRNSVDWIGRHRPSSSHSSESSSVSREGKKRLSERWKMTHRFQEAGLAGRGSTLGEMLAIPDGEVKPEISDSVIGRERYRDKFASFDGTAGWVGPLGISSKDGWKDGCIRNLSRSRSLPSSSAALGSPRTSMHREILRDDRYLIPKVAAYRGRQKAVKGNLSWTEGSFSSKSRLSAKKGKSPYYSDWEHSDSSQEILVCQNEVEKNFETDGSSEREIMVLDIHTSNVTDKILVVDATVEVKDENMIAPSEPPDEFVANPSASVSINDDSPGRDLNDLASKETSNEPSEEVSVPLSRTVIEPESPASSKEAEQPSPVSVLDAPFTDDLSSGSECFESLSADLQGLRMQLQLLKLESESYAEGPMAISSDEDVGEESMDITEGREIFRAEDSRESSYVVDVLTDSGFGNADPDMFMATWHSPECPIASSVFEKLEKKYHDQTSWLRAERRLLFDRINSGLVEIFQQFMDPHPWVMPLERRIGSKRSKQAIEYDLCKLLASQEKKMNKDLAETVLGKESLWLDLGDDIDVIGRELERLLIDELVVEVTL